MQEGREVEDIGNRAKSGSVVAQSPPICPRPFPLFTGDSWREVVGESLSVDRACAGSARESEWHELRREESCRVGEYDLDEGGWRDEDARGETREWREGGSEGKVGSRRGSAARWGAHGSGEYRVAKTAGGYDRPISPDLVEGGARVEVRVEPGYRGRLVIDLRKCGTGGYVAYLGTGMGPAIWA